MATSVATVSSITPGGISLPNSGITFKREFRLRSLSGSIDIDYASDTISSPTGPLVGQKIGSSIGINRSGCPTYRESRSLPSNRGSYINNRKNLSLAECRRRVSSPPQLAPSLNDLNALRQQDNDTVLEFQDLEDPCKAKIFSFLTTLERGVAARTCKDWSEHMRHPSLWSVIDLTVFPSCANSPTSGKPGAKFSPDNPVIGSFSTDAIFGSGNPPVICKSLESPTKECTIECYYGYRSRVSKFLRYLISIKPAIRELRFSLDIGDPEDGWMELLVELLKVSRCKELLVADLTWSVTPAKRPFLPDTSVTWSNSDYKELTFRRRHRQRLFVRLFDLFTATARNLTVLRLPFDWSERSRQVIGRLKNLRVLELRKYFQYGHVEPEAVHSLVQSAPCLESLTLELWNETYGGFSPYTISSPTLIHLDVSACRGVYFVEMSLPSLQKFSVARRPLSFHVSGVTGGGTGAPGAGQQGAEYIPCMYDVLCRGARSLHNINDFELCPDWTEECSIELEKVMCSVCSCRQHNSSQDDQDNASVENSDHRFV